MTRPNPTPTWPLATLLGAGLTLLGVGEWLRRCGR